MRKIWNICRWEMQLLFGKPRNYIMMFAAPLLFTLLFGSLLMNEEERFHILLVDEDHTVLSQTLYTKLKEENLPFTIEKSSRNHALQELENKNVTGVILISHGFFKSIAAGKDPQIRFQHVPDFTSSQTVTNVISNKLSVLNIEATASKVWSEYSQQNWEDMYKTLQKHDEEDSLIQHQVVVGHTSTENGLSRSATGFSIMFVMMTLISVTGTLIEMKHNGLWSRLLMTPTSQVTIMIGYLLSFFLIGWFQFGVLMMATHFIFGAEWGNPLQLLILISAMLLAIVSLGLAITSFCKTTEQQKVFANLIVISTCMLAGVYWPVAIMPEYMQKMAEFLPQTWAMRAFLDIAAGSFSWNAVGMLLLFTSGFMLIGLSRIRFQKS